MFLSYFTQVLIPHDMNKDIVGRKKEQESLIRYMNSEESEFIAIYGRRRVGKTFLVRKL